MAIMSFINGNILLVAVVVVILYFIIHYLNSSGYFKKIGLDFSKIDLSAFQQQDDFFAPAKETNNMNGIATKQNDDFFAVDLNNIGGVTKNGMENTKR